MVRFQKQVNGVSAMVRFRKQARDVIPEGDESSGAVVKPPKLEQATCLRVRVCGNTYTSLAWFLGMSKPGRKARQTAQSQCLERAVECQGGDTKTLAAQGFAKSSLAQGRELLPGRERLPHNWVDSRCLAVRSSRSGRNEKSEALQIRKAVGGDSCRGVLWRLEDLEKAFRS